MNTEEKVQIADTVIEEMTQAGLYFGHKTSKTHPKMKGYIGGVRNTVHVFDLEKTKKKLDEALEFLKKLSDEQKTILFVGTKVQVRSLIQEVGAMLGQPIVSKRWIGGMLTNFETIQKRVDQMKDLEQKQTTGELEKYTKKERADFNKLLQDLQNKFGGVKNMTKLPDAVFVCDLDENMLAAKEAKRKGVKVVGIVDTNIDPSIVDYVIPANDDAVTSVQYILKRVMETLKK